MGVCAQRREHVGQMDHKREESCGGELNAYLCPWVLTVHPDRKLLRTR